MITCTRLGYTTVELWLVSGYLQLENALGSTFGITSTPQWALTNAPNLTNVGILLFLKMFLHVFLYTVNAQGCE